MKNPTKEQIRKRAYEIYEREGIPGHDLDNWLRAERELRQEAEDDEREVSVWERKPASRPAVVSGSREYKRRY